MKRNKSDLLFCAHYGARPALSGLHILFNQQNQMRKRWLPSFLQMRVGSGERANPEDWMCDSQCMVWEGVTLEIVDV